MALAAALRPAAGDLMRARSLSRIITSSLVVLDHLVIRLVNLLNKRLPPSADHLLLANVDAGVHLNIFHPLHLFLPGLGGGLEAGRWRLDESEIPLHLFDILLFLQLTTSTSS